MASAFQIPYRQARDGYWEPQTSTLNWCEEDYNITFYCAEMVNTATNLIFIYLGYKGIKNCLLYSHPSVFILAYLGYMVIGLGSMAFHATLKYEMQLADELPMIYTTCIMGYANFSYRQSGAVRLGVAAFFGALAYGITAYYLHVKDPSFHQAAYAIMTICILGRGMYTVEYKLRPAMKQRNPAECDNIMKQMWRMAWTGMGMFLTGYFLWNMDNAFCGHFQVARNHIMLPWSAMLEGHGWWHILTGLGGYYFISWRVWLQRCLDGDEKEFMLKWPSQFTSVPVVVPRTGDKRHADTRKTQ